MEFERFCNLNIDGSHLNIQVVVNPGLFNCDHNTYQTVLRLRKTIHFHNTKTNRCKKHHKSGTLFHEFRNRSIQIFPLMDQEGLHI